MATRPWPVVASGRLAIEGVTAKGVPWANIFWIGIPSSGVPVTADLQSVCQSLYNVYATNFMSLLGKDATMQRAVLNWYGDQPTQVVVDYLHDTAGGSDNNTEIDSLSCAVSWRFAQTWRGGKPRTYLPALPSEAFADSNTLDPDFITAVESAAAAFITGVAGVSHGSLSGLALTVMSFFSGNAPRTTAARFVITGAVVHPRIDSMRRRLGREVT